MGTRNTTRLGVGTVAALIGLFAIHSFGSVAQKSSNPPAATEDGISVYFSPHGGCTRAIVKAIDSAKHRIDIQAYSFTSAPIAQAVVMAEKRGVHVTAIIDGGRVGRQYSEATFMTNHGIPTYADYRHKIAHNKIILIDNATIITGSFNFTNTAEQSNTEILLLIDNKPKLMSAYLKNFKHHLSHSKRYRNTG